MEITSFKKNHPKNAVGYLLALHAEGETNELFKKHVIQSVDDARHDAAGLGFIRAFSDDHHPTDAGYEAIRTIVYHYGDVLSALEAIEEQSGRSARFIDELPVMGVVTRQALISYRPTELLIDTLDGLASQGDTEPSLAKVAKRIARQRPTFALNLFVAPDERDDLRSGPSDELDFERFEDGEIYSTHTTFQYKAMLYHTGILTTRGSDTKSELDPSSVVWALENPMSKSTQQ